ncbi:MAG: glycosyltransferase family 2 protein [Kiritimatiellae bacterium]|nr:glycosyltransferase family 2 protein [Kiritimatiellia bacterium]
MIDLVRQVSGIGFVGLMAAMLLLSFLDRRRKRQLTVKPALSVLVPCYNDGASVGDTLTSVYASYDRDLLEVIVINDASRDDSAARLEALQRDYPFRVVTHAVNRGKSRCLNEAARLASHDLLLCLDADTQLNPKALTDLLARMESDRRLGAASCPYRPANRGVLPKMQEIEYNMLLLTQGAHNLTSAMALWGGCLTVRREALAQVKGFSAHALTEDVDLAFKLNRAGWRVEQSFVPVASIVPCSFRAWFRQKLRWTSGGLQCYVRHAPVWMRNPIQIFFVFSYSLLTLTSIPALFADLRFGEHIVGLFRTLYDVYPLRASLAQVYASYGADLIKRVVNSGAFCLLSVVYVLPLVQRTRDILKLLLVVPFSLAYFPAYILVSVIGIAIGLRSLRWLTPSAMRGW